MDIQRAQEIAKSSTMVNVTHNGVPVYIQHVDSQKETARIYPISQPENEQVVPVSNLIER